MAKRRGKANYGLAAFVVFVRRLFELDVDRRAWVALVAKKIVGRLRACAIYVFYGKAE